MLLHESEGFGPETQHNNNKVIWQLRHRGKELRETKLEPGRDMKGKGERRKILREEDRVRDIKEEKRRLKHINESLRIDLGEKRKRDRAIPKPRWDGGICDYGG